MASFATSSSSKHSALIKANNIREKDETRIGRMSASAVVDDLKSSKDLRIISLKDESGELPEGIECIAADFAKVQKGVINSIVSPITLKLKNEEHKKNLKLTSLDKIKSIFSKVMKGDERPFVRFEKVQIMYVPLFGEEEHEHGEMTVSLMDAGKESAGYDPIIQTVSFKADSMALVELSMNFFVAKKDMNSISLVMSVDQLPIQGREYASMMIAFFIHEEHSPMRLTVRPSTLIYVDSLDAPIDINTTSVFKGLGDKIHNEIKGKRSEMIKKKNLNNTEMRRKMRNVRISKSSESEDNDGEEKEILDVISKNANHKEEAFYAPMTEETKRTIRVEANYKTMLDTGAGEHYIYTPSPIKVHKHVNHFGGIDKFPVEKANVKYVVDGEVFHLGDAWLFNDLRVGSNLLSYTKMKEVGLVDSMTTEGDTLFLEKDKTIVMQFDTRSPARMWLMDSIWHKEKDILDGKVELMRDGPPGADVRKGLGIKYNVI